jgi:oligopeptide transport system substrate-binding protein
LRPSPAGKPYRNTLDTGRALNTTSFAMGRGGPWASGPVVPVCAAIQPPLAGRQSRNACPMRFAAATPLRDHLSGNPVPALQKPRLAMRLLSLVAAGLVVMALAGRADAGTVLNRPMEGEPESLDPQKTGSAFPIGVIREMFTGLLTLTNDGKPVPGVAESWDISPDGKSWTFHLRHDTKWSNGDPVTAEDFVYSFRRLVDPATAANDPSDLKQLVNYEAIQSGKEKDLTKLGVDAPDQYTLHLALTEPRLALKFLLTDVWLAPLHRATIEKWGIEWTRPGHIVGNGPYRMQDWVPQDKITLVKNPNFYDAATVKIDEVRWINAPQFDAALNRYRAGELDWVEVRRSRYAWAKQNLPDQLHHANDNTINFLPINMVRGVLAQDVRLREALNLAIDRELIVTKISPLDQKAAYSIVPPVVSDYTPQDMKMKGMTQAERVQRAKELVAAAGYTPDHPLKLAVSYPTEDNTRQILLSMQQMLQPVGINLELNNMEWQIYVGALNQKTYEIGFMGANAPYDDYEDGLDNYRSDAGDGNWTGYNSKTFDDLFHRGGTATDIGTRRELMETAERQALADFPVVPLYYGVVNRVVSPRVQGVVDAIKVPQSRYLSVKD